MAKIEITLINAQDGQPWPAEVVTDKPVGWWIDQILQALNLPREEKGKRVHYQFVLECSGRVVREEETLQSAEVQVGDRLRLERARQKSISPAPKSAGETKRVTSLGKVGIALAGAAAILLVTWGLVLILNGRKLHTIHLDNISDVAFSPDGKILATNNPESPWGIILWDVRTGKQLQNLYVVESGCCYPSLAFSPSGRILAGGGWSEFVFLFDLQTGQKQEIKLQSEWMTVAISPDETILAVVSPYSIQLLDLQTGQLFWAWNEMGFPASSANPVIPVAFSPDGTILASVINLDVGSTESEPSLLVRLWNVGTGQQIKTLGPYWDVGAVVFSPNGHLVIASDDSACVINLQVPEQAQCLTGFYFGDVTAISPDFKRLAVSGYGEIYVLDMQTGEKLYTLKGHEGSIARLAFSPDGRLLASSATDGTVIVWEASP